MKKEKKKSKILAWIKKKKTYIMVFLIFTCLFGIWLIPSRKYKIYVDTGIAVASAFPNIWYYVSNNTTSIYPNQSISTLYIMSSTGLDVLVYNQTLFFDVDFSLIPRKNSTETITGNWTFGNLVVVNLSASNYWNTTEIQDRYYNKTQSDARYLQSESDPYWTANRSSFWNSTEIRERYYNKTESDARYLQSYTETDPIWTSDKPSYWNISDIQGKYYNKTDIDSQMALKLDVADQRYNDTALVYSVGNWSGNMSSYWNISDIQSRYYNKTDSDGRYLMLDQSSPQTIVNGVPYLNASIDNITDLKHLVTKEYVDLAVTSLGATYYMYDEDDPTGYKLTHLDPSSDSETYLEYSGLTDGQYLAGWISAEGEAPDKLLKGVYNWFITMEKTSGTKDVRVYWKLVERTESGNEIEIAQSSYSNQINGKSTYMVPLQLDSDHILNSSGSRIVGKLYANVYGSGNSPTVRIYYQGNTSSRWEIPANDEIFSNIFVRKDGDSMTGNLSVPNISITALTSCSKLYTDITGNVLCGVDNDTVLTESDPYWVANRTFFWNISEIQDRYYNKTESDARYLQNYTETDPFWAGNFTLLSDGYIPFVNGTSLSNSPLYVNLSSIGIGTTSPSSMLHVVGGAVRVDTTGKPASQIVYRTDGKAGSLTAGTGAITFRFDDSGDFKIQSQPKNEILAETGSGIVTIVDIDGDSPANSLVINSSGATKIKDLQISEKTNCGRLYTDANGTVLCGSSSGGSEEIFYAYKLDTQTIPNSWTSITFSNVVRQDSSFSFSAGGSQITIQPGDYIITFECGADVNDTTRSHVDWGIFINGIGCPGCYAYTYHRTSADGKDSMSITIYHHTTQAITVELKGKSDRASQISTASNSCRVLMRKIG